jgi:hypothetical protein
LDRGFDRDELMLLWLRQRVAFVIQQRGDRHVCLADGRPLAITAVADEQPRAWPRRWPKAPPSRTFVRRRRSKARPSHSSHSTGHSPISSSMVTPCSGRFSPGHSYDMVTLDFRDHIAVRRLGAASAFSCPRNINGHQPG